MHKMFIRVPSQSSLSASVHSEASETEPEAGAVAEGPTARLAAEIQFLAGGRRQLHPLLAESPWNPSCVL